MNATFDLVLRSVVTIGVDIAWKSALVLLAASALALLLRRASAAARHLAWCLGLAGSLVLPALALVAPVWVWPILPVYERPQATLALVSAQPSSITAATVGPRPPLPARIETLTRDHSASDAPSSDAQSVGLRVAGSPAFPFGPQSPARTGLPSLSLWAWLVGVWAAVACAILSAPIVGMITLTRLARSARPVAGGDWAALLLALRTQLDLTRPVTVLESGRAVMPMTWGWLRPVILVPVEADHWPIDRRRDVLLHELAHIRRLDCLTQTFAQLACAVYWCNPLVWLAAHRMRIERERACDDLVLRAGSQACDYAQHLLEQARALRSHRQHLLAALAMARPSQLEGRLLAILDSRCPRRGVTRAAVVLGLVALLIGTLPLSAVRLATRAAVAGPPRNQTAAAPPSRQEKPPSPSPAAKATVIGRVVGPHDKPVSGARLVMFAERRQPSGGGENGTRRDVWTAQSDADGRFQLEFPLIPAEDLERLYVEASASGFGFDGIDLKTDAARQETTVTMAPEQIVDGRLIDVHGQPATGVSVRIRELNIQRHGYGSGLPGDVPTWPAPVTTSPDGRFRLPGTSERAVITLEIDDPRFAHQLLVFAAGEEGRARPKTVPLLPPQVINVRVVRGDDGKPMAGAWVVVQAGEESTGARADEKGRVRISSWPGGNFKIVAYARDGEPYIRCETSLAWPKGAVEQSVEVKLRRGVILRGKVVEEPSGKPVAGANISYYQTYRNNPLYLASYNRDAASGRDGTFTLAVPYGPGHLLVQGPSADYLHETTSHGELGTGWGPNLHMYPDALAHLDLKREETTHPVELRMRRGVTVKGRAIGPDGAPIAEAFAMGRTYVPYSRYRRPFAPFSGVGPQLPVRDGRFEIPGCDPERMYTFHFLDVTHQLGATVEVSGKSAATGPVTVKFEKCGSARVRFKDPDGKPVAGRDADEFPGWMTLIITPGAEFDAESTNADMEFQVNLDHRRNGDQRTGPDGCATYVSLIPGARYRYRGHEFTAKAGQTIDLPDVTVARKKD
jgi:beta-lactamase regulating signal transducer with metallopeptidase domain